MSGFKVLQSWLAYRMPKGAGKKSSPLDQIRPTAWRFDAELLDLWWVLGPPVDLWPSLAQALNDIFGGGLPLNAPAPPPKTGGRLAAGIGEQASAPRILRDFARLNSLIKSVAVLRHPHRKRDSKGKIIAEIADYQIVYDLVGQMYETTLTGASLAVREVVQAVSKIGEDCTAADLAAHLRVNKSTAWRRAKTAIRNGWLINTETRKGYPASLKLGDPLPKKIGLPSPERLRGCKAVAGGATGGATDKPMENNDDSEHGCTVASHADDLFPLHGEIEL